MATPNPYSATHEELQPAQSSARRGWLAVGLLVVTVTLPAIAITAVVAFVLGGIIGQVQLYHSRAEQQAAKMRTYLGSQGDRFGEITIEEASNEWSYLAGTVDTQEDAKDLREEMQRLFGEELGIDMTQAVEVREQAVPPPAPN